MKDIPFEKQVHIGESTHIIAPEEHFTCPMDDCRPETVEKAKKLMCEIAGEMGFSRLKGDWSVQRYYDQDADSMKWRLEAKFTGLTH